MIAVWEGKIEAGSETSHPSAFWDVFPTVADAAGFEAPEGIDGMSFLPTLLGKDDQKEHEYLYWEFHEQGGRKALRKGDWKLVNYNVFNPGITKVELYNIPADPGEQKNVADDHPEIVEELNKLMESARTESEIFSFESKTVIQ
jgi:arylsulfatase A